MKDFNKKQIEEDIRRLKDNAMIQESCLNFYITLVNEWLETPGSLYLGCAKNKLGDILVTLYRNNIIYLMGKSYRTIMYAPKIMFHRISDTHIHIDDVLMKYNDIGNGSVAIEALLKYTKSIGVKVITGDLSSMDDDHIERRNHFYKKFGFEISEKNIKKYIL